MKLDRELQRKILERLAEEYKEPIENSLVYFSEIEPDIAKLQANISYLEEHGLIENKEISYIGPAVPFYFTKITARGMDFLADDGGLSAILGIVTIKIHDDTLRNLIEMKIMASDLSQPDKKKWTDALRELPAESIKHLTMTILDKGLENLPVILPLIGKCLFS